MIARTYTPNPLFALSVPLQTLIFILYFFLSRQLFFSLHLHIYPNGWKMIALRSDAPDPKGLARSGFTRGLPCRILPFRELSLSRARRDEGSWIGLYTYDRSPQSNSISVTDAAVSTRRGRSSVAINLIDMPWRECRRNEWALFRLEL